MPYLGPPIIVPPKAVRTYHGSPDTNPAEAGGPAPPPTTGQIWPRGNLNR